MKNGIKGTLELYGYYSITILSVFLVLSLIITTSIAVSEVISLPVTGEEEFEPRSPRTFSLSSFTEKSITLASLDTLETGMTISSSDVIFSNVKTADISPSDFEWNAHTIDISDAVQLTDDIITGQEDNPADTYVITYEEPLPAYEIGEAETRTVEKYQRTDEENFTIEMKGDVGILGTTTPSCRLHSGCYSSYLSYYCNPYGYPYSCTLSCDKMLYNCDTDVYNNHYFCYEDGQCQSMAPSDCNGQCEADLETTCYCGCVDPYPNECGDTCWGDCTNPSYPHWNCKDDGNAACCADGYPYYCDRTGNCWGQSWQCDEAIICGGSWWVCGSESSVENCHNGNVYCCPSSHSYYCPQTGFCVQSSSHCCTNECSTAGSTRCLTGSDEQTCGDYDSDACLEWGGDVTCFNGCSGGGCVSRVDIEGAFRSLEDDAPITGRTVRLTDCSDNDVSTDVTNADGHFSFRENPGNYKIKLEMPYGTLVLKQNGNDCLYYGNDIDFGSISVRTKFVITGSLQDEYGDPIQGATAQLTDCSGVVADSVQTGSDGSFSLGHYYGNYEIKIIHDSTTYTLEFGGEACNYYEPTDYAINSPVVIYTDTHVRGVIEDEYGNGWNGLTVQLTYCDDSIVYSAATAGDGSFELIGDPGDYRIKILTGFGSLLLTINGNDCNYYGKGLLQFTSPIVIESETHVYGYATELNGNPIEGMTVELYGCADDFVTSDVTDSTGYFSLSADSGRYKLKVVIGGERYLLEDSEGGSCFIFMGDIPLDLNIGVDCSEYDYQCYYGNWKLFGCHFDPNVPSCSCYYEVCSNGCTPGLPECDVPTGTIHVDVDNKNNYYKPLPGATIFVDSYYAGVTDSLGKRTVQAEYGYRNVKINCPDDSYCGGRNVYVDGNEYVYFKCECETDTDGDGLSDSDEILIGTDPNDASEDLLFIFNDNRILKSCFQTAPLFSGMIGIKERSRLMKTLGKLDSEFIAVAQHDEEKVLEIISMSGITADKLVENPVGAVEMLQKSSFADGVEVDGAVVLVLTDEYGVTSVFYFGAACTGQIAGLVSGAIGGLEDDVNLVVAIIKGLWYLHHAHKGGKGNFG